MINKLINKQLVQASRCDFTGCLSIPNCFAEFQDIASEHAELLGIGADSMMKNNLFWLTVKSKIHIEKMPKLLTNIEISTWPEKADRLSCNRDYTITQNNETLVTGKTLWAVYNLETKRLVQADSIYPEDLVINEEYALPVPFLTIPDKFESEPFGEYIVKSTDIDIGNHMNNIAYIRATLGLFSTNELSKMNIKDIEFQYKNQCFEGNKLLFYKKETDSGLLIKAATEDGKTVLLASIS